MYSDIPNVNILTSLLISHGVRHAVVCPGSRNAPIVHNLNETSSIKCHPVTDERTAGFYAIGISQAIGMQPVVVCVTSGSALLNVAPAVAEAYYQHVPLVVVSADRPAQWVDQLDGQTIHQPNALDGNVVCSVDVSEPHDEQQHWHCNLLINKALIAAKRGLGSPVHINVQISEPLFHFNIPSLPDERKISEVGTNKNDDFTDLTSLLAKSQRPLLVIGKMGKKYLKPLLVDTVRQKMVTFYEPLSSDCRFVCCFDQALKYINDDETAYNPDFIIYIGDTLVSKRIKHFMRRCKAPCYMAMLQDKFLPDPVMNTRYVQHISSANALLHAIEASIITQDKDIGISRQSFLQRWNILLNRADKAVSKFRPVFSAFQVIRYFESQFNNIGMLYDIHYANSSVVRLANLCARHYVWCNRGVNGIEGSLSTAAGFSLVTSSMVFCVIGDLSFFYDSNALSSAALCGNLRVLLVNNGCGSIFENLNGLSQSPCAKSLIGASHNHNAEGLCATYGARYLSASSENEMYKGIHDLVMSHSDKPVVLEVFTNPNIDAAMLSMTRPNTKP